MTTRRARWGGRAAALAAFGTLAVGALTGLAAAIRFAQARTGFWLAPAERPAEVAESAVVLGLAALALLAIGTVLAALWWRLDPGASVRRLRRWVGALLVLLAVPVGASGAGAAFALIRALALTVLLTAVAAAAAAALLWMGLRMTRP